MEDKNKQHIKRLIKAIKIKDDQIKYMIEKYEKTYEGFKQYKLKTKLSKVIMSSYLNDLKNELRKSKVKIKIEHDKSYLSQDVVD